jgi:hypothetical protein
MPDQPFVKPKTSARLREKTGLGERMVRYHFQVLADCEVDEPGATPGPLGDARGTVGPRQP